MKQETQKQRIGRLAASRGKRYERKIINEFKKFGYKNIGSSRMHSRAMDNMGVDIVDPSGEFPIYVQLKATMSCPQLGKMFREFELTDKPYIIIWNKQIPAGEKQQSDGEYVFLKKEYFYELFKKYYNLEEVQDTNLIEQEIE